MRLYTPAILSNSIIIVGFLFFSERFVIMKRFNSSNISAATDKRGSLQCIFALTSNYLSMYSLHAAAQCAKIKPHQSHFHVGGFSVRNFEQILSKPHIKLETTDSDSEQRALNSHSARFKRAIVDVIWVMSRKLYNAAASHLIIIDKVPFLTNHNAATSVLV